MAWLKTFAKPPEGYTFRDFEPQDCVAIEGVEIEHTIIGGTMEKDGVPVAYAGINRIGERNWVFFFVKDDEIRKHGLWVVRLVRDALRVFRDGGVTDVYALCDLSKPKAAEFLTVLGFKPIDVYEKPFDVLLYEKLMGAKAWRRRDGET